MLFSSPTTNPQYAGLKVWCIQKLNAIKENENWVFENLIEELSKSWSTEKVGFIEYIFPPNHQFDVEEAKLGQNFELKLFKGLTQISMSISITMFQAV